MKWLKYILRIVDIVACACVCLCICTGKLFGSMLYKQQDYIRIPACERIVFLFFLCFIPTPTSEKVSSTSWRIHEFRRTEYHTHTHICIRACHWVPYTLVRCVLTAEDRRDDNAHLQIDQEPDKYEQRECCEKDVHIRGWFLIPIAQIL